MTIASSGYLPLPTPLLTLLLLALPLFFRHLLSPSSASPKVEPQDGKSQRQQDLGKTYVEQCLSVDQLAEIYSDSYIDSTCPENSDGLSTLEAR